MHSEVRNLSSNSKLRNAKLWGETLLPITSICIQYTGIRVLLEDITDLNGNKNYGEMPILVALNRQTAFGTSTFKCQLQALIYRDYARSRLGSLGRLFSGQAGQSTAKPEKSMCSIK